MLFLFAIFLSTRLVVGFAICCTANTWSTSSSQIAVGNPFQRSSFSSTRTHYVINGILDICTDFTQQMGLLQVALIHGVFLRCF